MSARHNALILDANILIRAVRGVLSISRVFFVPERERGLKVVPRFGPAHPLHKSPLITPPTPSPEPRPPAPYTPNPQSYRWQHSPTPAAASSRESG
jgi:hypothetical protein